MSTAGRYRELRSGYYRRVELGVVIAVGVHALLFTLSPPYVPRPFHLPAAERPLRLVEEPGGARVAAAPAPAPGVRASMDVPAPAIAAIEGEQLETVPANRARAAATVAGGGEGAAGGGGGAGEGTGIGDEPPVFYSYETAPRVVRRVEPEYPLRARVAGEEGTVVINVNVDAAGRILRAWVAQSTAPESLVEAALDAIYQFQFLPGKQGGYPVKCTVAIPFHFSLKRVS